MVTIEEKAQEYAKKTSLPYGVFGASTQVCDAIKEVAEKAYLKCYEDIMALPLSEKLTEGEKVKIRKMFHEATEDASSDYVIIFRIGLCFALRSLFGFDFFKGGGGK